MSARSSTLLRKRQAKVLRIFRSIHRITGALLFVFFFFIAVTGLVLGWKSHTQGLILPKSAKGTSSNLADWLPVARLHELATQALHQQVSADLSVSLDRIDIRQQKGIVKFIYETHYWEVQLDGATGEVLQIQRRWADLIENVHDGSILDFYFGTTNDFFKVFYTTIMGLALLLFTITGFWLWYGPKRMKRTQTPPTGMPLA